MKLSDLIGLPVLDATGRRLGRLQEIRVVDGKAAELVYGSAGLFERITGRAQPTALPWARVEKIGGKKIRLR
jgi:sporulation protein YlmC with PRC-barrel domain